MVKEMQSKAPMPYDLFEVKERLKYIGALSSTNIFLREEIDRIQRVIILLRATLKDLLLAIEGTIIMSGQLRDALDKIFNACVPAIWQRGSWASLTVEIGFTGLLERNEKFHTWCFNVRFIYS
uniref:Dynein heavy chain C-terminal domain-containing protein n=1 Tax=Glossina palpalis gambiensis TaxID=67801 RepID=A0A1B0C333_9MUSC